MQIINFPSTFCFLFAEKMGVIRRFYKKISYKRRSHVSSFLFLYFFQKNNEKPVKQLVCCALTHTFHIFIEMKNATTIFNKYELICNSINFLNLPVNICRISYASIRCYYIALHCIIVST